MKQVERYLHEIIRTKNQETTVVLKCGLSLYSQYRGNITCCMFAYFLQQRPDYLLTAMCSLYLLTFWTASHCHLGLLFLSTFVPAHGQWRTQKHFKAWANMFKMPNFEQNHCTKSNISRNVSGKPGRLPGQ
jgi:hypothetical protein